MSIFLRKLSQTDNPQQICSILWGNKKGNPSPDQILDLILRAGIENIFSLQVPNEESPLNFLLKYFNDKEIEEVINKVVTIWVKIDRGEAQFWMHVEQIIIHLGILTIIRELSTEKHRKLYNLVMDDSDFSNYTKTEEEVILSKLAPETYRLLTRKKNDNKGKSIYQSIYESQTNNIWHTNTFRKKRKVRRYHLIHQQRGARSGEKIVEDVFL